MTPYEEELLTKYLTQLNILGEDGAFADFEEWYQMVRYANGDGAPRTVEEALGAALQGRPGGRPGLQPAAGNTEPE